MGAEDLRTEELADFAQEACIFAFPRSRGHRDCFATFLVPSQPSSRGPMNEIHGDPVTLHHNFRDAITPEADTPYSMAAPDLRTAESPSAPDQSPNTPAFTAAEDLPPHD